MWNVLPIAHVFCRVLTLPANIFLDQVSESACQATVFFTLVQEFCGSFLVF